MNILRSSDVKNQTSMVIPIINSTVKAIPSIILFLLLLRIEIFGSSVFTSLGKADSNKGSKLGLFLPSGTSGNK